MWSRSPYFSVKELFFLEYKRLRQWLRIEKVTWKVKLRCFKLYRAYTSVIIFHLVQFVKCWHFFLENSKRLYRSSRKEKKSLSCLYVLHKSEIRYFHVVVVQWRRRMYKKACTSRVVVLPKLSLLFFFAVLVDAAIVVAPKCGSNVSGC